MAKISIEVDTSEKTVAVKVDDKKVANVRDIYIYTPLSGYFAVDIGMQEEAGEDLQRVSRLCAYGSQDKVPPKAKASVEFPGMMVVEQKGYSQEDISAALGLTR